MPPAIRLGLLNSQLFQPPEPPGTEIPSADVLDYKELRIETTDGESLRGWWIKTRKRRRGHMLFCHANAEDISGCIPYAELLTDIGFDTLLFDCRGYGGNAGAISEEGTYLDAEAALQCMRGLPGVDQERVFYFGRSLGGAVALKLACEHPPAGLVLLSTFASVREVPQAWYPFVPAALFRLIPDLYPSIRRVKKLRAPLLVLHGEQDKFIPPAEGKKLYKAARRPKKFVLGDYDHNDFSDDAWTQLAKDIVAWHKELRAAKPRATRSR
jgi:fermentation-respiration switch protein FrsA (DUF1100 family)